VSEALIEIKNLSLSFPSEDGYRRVLHHLSLSIPKGKTLGVLGESGSGKSLTALALMRLLPKTVKVDRGEILYHHADGKIIDLLSLSEKEMLSYRGKRIAMIFQEPMTSLNPTIRLGQQVAEVLQIHTDLSEQAIYEKVIALFKKVKLPRPEKLYKAYPHEVSGGQKQRVMIAMALAVEPDLIIADEPTTALDVTVQKRVLDLLAEIQKEYKTAILFITHDIGVMAHIADEIAVLYNGKKIEQETAKAIIKQPQEPYTKGLIACQPPIETRPQRLLTVDDFLQEKADVVQRSLTSTAQYDKPPILEVNHVDVEYTVQRNFFGKETRSYKAVADVSFQLFRGETLGLVGESGCGKTSLSRALLRLLPYRQGDIYFAGKSIDDFNASEMTDFRRRFQIVFQDPYSALNPRITVGSTIMEVFKVHRKGKPENRRERVLKLLKQVGLDETAYDRYPSEFSGGQRQRIVIARALAVEPEVLICDESVSALDVSVQAQILNLLNDLKDRYGLTYLFISHDLSVVKYMSDRIMVMQNGQLVELDTAEKVFFEPQREYTKQLLEAVFRVEK
jgi:peptide/nickel transport system ATP-binding protein